MSRGHVVVRKIRPSDPGYGSASARLFPWLCLPHEHATFGRGFRTQPLAFAFAERLAAGLALVVR